MPAKFSDFVGEPNFLRIKQEELAKPEKDTPSQPDPSLWELRNYLVENFAMGLGSEYVKENMDKWNYKYYQHIWSKW